MGDPGSVCKNSDISLHFDPNGRCEEGHCIYDSFEEPCPDFGCDFATGLCAPDLCDGVTCQTPPSVCFGSDGTCGTGGACSYPPLSEIDCIDSDPCTYDDTCQQGACRGTPRVCETAPDPTCNEALTHLVTYDEMGYCDDLGACQYIPHEAFCEYGCENAQCKGNPCVPPDCNDGNECTADECIHGVGCQRTPRDNAGCTSSSDDCPAGHCQGTACIPDSGLSCMTEVPFDLCQDIEVEGVCTSAGDCVVEEVPPQYYNPNSDGLFIVCYFIEFCWEI